MPGMSSQITVTAALDVQDVRTVAERRPRWIAGGPVYVSISGPTELAYVDHDGRREMIDDIARAIRLKYSTVGRNHELVAMLRDMADRIESGAQASETLAPLLIGEVEQAFRTP